MAWRTMALIAATCRVTITLARGTLHATTRVTPSAAKGTIAVVGGTGAYAGATGTGTLTNLSRAGTRTAIVLTLR